MAVLPDETTILPLAITRFGDGNGCVGGLADNGTWIRPLPMTEELLTGPQKPFSYKNFTRVRLAPRRDGQRIEDRDMVSFPSLGSEVSEEDRARILARNSDENVEAVFEATDRTLGIVEVQIENVSIRRFTGRRKILRCTFLDTKGERYDWMVPEIRLNYYVANYGDDTLRNQRAMQISDWLQRIELIYAVIGLTTPNERFPGRYRGCHPLIVGLHTLPDFSKRYLNDEYG